FSGRRRHTGCYRDWSSDVCSSDLAPVDDRHPLERQVLGLVQQEAERARGRAQAEGEVRAAEEEFEQIGRLLHQSPVEDIAQVAQIGRAPGRGREKREVRAVEWISR